MKELIMAAISLHAVMRHQNQRKRYRSPVPAPMERMMSKFCFADSRFSVSHPDAIISRAVTMRPTAT